MRFGSTYRPAPAKAKHARRAVTHHLSVRTLLTLLGALLASSVVLAPAPPAHAGPVCDVPVPPPICRGEDDHPPVDDPPQPPPVARMTSSGLNYARDVDVRTGSATPPLVEISSRDRFHVTAHAGNATATAVRLVGRRTVTCSTDGEGWDEFREVTELDSGFVAPSKTYTWPPMSCGSSAYPRLTSGSLVMHAEARDAHGNVTRTPDVTFRYLQRREKAYTVPEASSLVDTKLLILPGDRLRMSGAGSIWSGMWFRPENGPDGDWGYCPGNEGHDGWFDLCVNPAGYPMTYGAPRYSLIGALDFGWFYIGNGWILDYTGPPTTLKLRVNDNVPGNGSGAFRAVVAITR